MQATAMTRIEGPLNFSRVVEVLSGSHQFVSAGKIDLSAIKSMDSVGISLLLELSRRAQKIGGSLEIHGASPQVRALADFFKVEPLLRFVDP